MLQAGDYSMSGCFDGAKDSAAVVRWWRGMRWLLAVVLFLVYAGPSWAEETSEISLQANPPGTQVLETTKRKVLVMSEATAETRIAEYSVDTISDYSSRYGRVVRFDNEAGGEVRGVVGDVEQSGSYWHVESADDSGLHVMTEIAVPESEAAENEEARCGSALHLLSPAEQTAFSELQEDRRAAVPSALPLSSSLREIELVVVASGDFSEGRSEGEVLARVASTVEAANLYLESLGLKIDLVGVQIFQPGRGDPYAEATAQRNALGMLTTTRQLWFSRQDPSHDAVVVFGKSFFNNVYGLAFPSSSCLMPEFSYLFVTQGRVGPTGEVGLAATLAHELGHYLGMNHDNALGLAGPTMMWPFFSANPAGFSDFSVSEWLKHESDGGGQCFSTAKDVGITSSSEVFSFAAGVPQQLDIVEGDRLQRLLLLQGAAADTVYRASGLPDSAYFNPSTGVLLYEPGFDVVPSGQPWRRFDIILSAVSQSGTVDTPFALYVYNSNRQPKLFMSSSDVVEFQAGSSIEIGVVGLDPDADDTVVVQLLNRAVTNGYPGRPQIIERANTALLQWNIPVTAAGEYLFLFSGIDKSGERAYRLLTVRITALNSAPVLLGPDEVVTGTGGLIDVTISANDADGTIPTLDFIGAPPGTVVEYGAGFLRFEYRPQSAGPEQHSITVSADDGKVVSRRVVKLTVIAGGPPPKDEPALWPGVAGVAQLSGDLDDDGKKELTLYDQRNGIWQQFNCDGARIGSKQFGGLVGDRPFLVEQHSGTRRAIYRTWSGIGYWFIEAPGTELGYISFSWGLAGGVPIVGDLDGDRQSDYTVYFPRLNQWYVLATASPGRVLSDTELGADTLRHRHPFVADIDGDGRADRILVVRKTDASMVAHVWLADGRHNAFVIDRFPQSEAATPYVLDLDEDGRADFALRRTTGALRAFASRDARVFSFGTASATAQITSADCGTNSQRRLLLTQGSSVSQLSLGTSALQQVSSLSDENGQALSVPTALSLETASGRHTSTTLASPLGDIDGDGTSNLAVFRPGPLSQFGQWYEESAYFAGFSYPWIEEGAGFPLAGDIFGEGSQRLIVYGNGTWYVQRLGEIDLQLSWGIAGDRPVLGDYNGDGRDDLAIYRPRDSSWWILFRYADGSQEARVVSWGQPGDIPVQADYDGDGSTDVAVWNPTKGEWAIRFADGSFKVIVLGQEGDIAVPADYLGEGRAQVAVWRPETGVWFIVRGLSQLDVVAWQWGLSNDRPLRIDRDGDGVVELTVWRPADGNWYMRSISQPNEARAVSIAQFGLSGDLPLGAEMTQFLP